MLNLCVMNHCFVLLLSSYWKKIGAGPCKKPNVAQKKNVRMTTINHGPKEVAIRQFFVQLFLFDSNGTMEMF